MLIIQSSSSTKDYGDVFKAISEVGEAKVLVNIVSLVGETHIFRVNIAIFRNWSMLVEGGTSRCAMN